MNKAKMIKALELLIEAVKEDGVVTPDTTVEAVKEAPAKEAKKAPKKEAVKEEVQSEPEEAQEESGAYTKEQLDGMTYNNLKKLAKDLGVKAVGTRDNITEAILGANAGATSDDDGKTSEPEKEDESKVVPISKGKKSKKAKPVEEPVEEEESEEEMDDLEKAVRAEAEDISLEELAELLQDAGIKASGKKAKLVDLLVQAVKDGAIEWEEDEEEESDTEEESEVEDDSEESEAEEAEEAEEDESEDEEVDFFAYHEDYDVDDLNAPDSMTAKRKKAVKKMITRELSAIEKGDTTEENIREFIETLLTEEEMEAVEDDIQDEDTLVVLYLELMKALIDDDGEAHEPNDPYEINEENVCCGRRLKYDSKTNSYVCEACGEVYEAE